MIILENVSFMRQNKQILNDIDLHVKAGQHWVLMGLNGSGKSTLLSIVSGQNWPTTGQVQVLGETFGQTRMPDLKKRMGWVGSTLNTRINQYDTVERIVLSGMFASIGIYQDYTPDDLADVQQVLSSLNISHLSPKKYLECSQGQQQMVLIARALVAIPELLILDEPCNGLDLFATEQILALIQALIQDDASPTIIFVTHHISQIIPEFSHCLLLKDGNIYQQGPTKKLLNTATLSDFYDQDVTVIETERQRYIAYID